MKSSEKIWFLKGCELLSQLSPSQLSELERNSQTRKFPAKTPVYLSSEASNSVYLVGEGLVKIGNLTKQGKFSTLAFIEQGEIFGEFALFDTAHRGEYVETVSKTLLVRIPKEAFQKIMSTDFQLTLKINKLLGLRRYRIEQRLKNLLFVSNYDRLAYLLLELAEHYGVECATGVRIRLKLSHQELASLIGSTRETVTIALAKMRAESLVTGKRMDLIIPNPARLAQSVES